MRNNKKTMKNKSFNLTLSLLQVIAITLLVISAQNISAKGLLPSPIYYPEHFYNISTTHTSYAYAPQSYDNANNVNFYLLNKHDSLYIKLGVHDIRNTIYVIQGAAVNTNITSAEPINPLQKNIAFGPNYNPLKTTNVTLSIDLLL
ncbi:hypothetical protein [Cysteiniphilum halobium]|uniref:hypothetical protein n=1 Tax=Cysteiniphilum halobium TaxID=2219059 RepID=UPI000E657EBD|nr:hypothetical protein [Cysteiniphilum halobium]